MFAYARQRATNILAQNGKNLQTLKLSARRQKLTKLMARIQAPTIRCSQVFFDGHALFKACADRRMEGIVSKRVDRPYVSGQSKDWIKVKCPSGARRTVGGTSFSRRDGSQRD